MKNSNRLEANKKIRAYWDQVRLTDKVNRDPIKKKNNPSFTGHGPSSGKKRHLRWRSRRGTKSNFLERPKIGFKNKCDHRFRKCNGVLQTVVHNVKELESLAKGRKNYEVFFIGRTVGARKRMEILARAITLDAPLYVNR